MIRRTFIKSVILGISALVIFSFAATAYASKHISKKELKKQLCEHSLVVVKDGKISSYDGRGIRPVFDYLSENNFKDAFVADRIIGKASALLLVYGQVDEVYTPVISKPAVKVFEDNNIKYSADKIVDNIINRSGTDLCLMEKKVQNIDNPTEAYELFSRVFK